MAHKIFYYCVLLLHHFQCVTGIHNFSFMHEATEDQRYLLKITRVIKVARQALDFWRLIQWYCLHLYCIYHLCFCCWWDTFGSLLNFQGFPSTWLQSMGSQRVRQDWENYTHTQHVTSILQDTWRLVVTLGTFCWEDSENASGDMERVLWSFNDAAVNITW